MAVARQRWSGASGLQTGMGPRRCRPHTGSTANGLFLGTRTRSLMKTCVLDLAHLSTRSRWRLTSSIWRREVGLSAAGAGASSGYRGEAERRSSAPGLSRGSRGCLRTSSGDPHQYVGQPHPPGMMPAAVCQLIVSLARPAWTAPPPPRSAAIPGAVREVGAAVDVGLGALCFGGRATWTAAVSPARGAPSAAPMRTLPLTRLWPVFTTGSPELRRERPSRSRPM